MAVVGLSAIVAPRPHRTARAGAPPGIDAMLGVRRVFAQRFPFSLYFVELPTRYRVLAVATHAGGPSTGAIDDGQPVWFVGAPEIVEVLHRADPGSSSSTGYRINRESGAEEIVEVGRWTS
jgi:hypothetical protein